MCTSGCFSSGNGFESKQAGFCNKPVKRQPSFYPHMSTDKNTWSSSHPNHSLPSSPSCIQSVKKWHHCLLPCQSFFRPPPPLFFLFMLPCSHILLFFPSLVFLVCSSAPVSMKIQPLNQTALMVSWERPLTVYHPPITSYMVSYSWVKRDVADEKTFTKTGDQSMVSVAV